MAESRLRSMAEWLCDLWGCFSAAEGAAAAVARRSEMESKNFMVMVACWNGVGTWSWGNGGGGFYKISEDMGGRYRGLRRRDRWGMDALGKRLGRCRKAERGRKGLSGTFI